ncbi:MAG: carbohydrate-binding family 9-like protein [Verrucomicrobia bacterium]|nr:carbohydrate-binding family 9-like protein [Verrucomicrobiota bacterium]
MRALPANLPLLRCPKRLFGPVAADPQAAPWTEMEGFPLHETASGDKPQQATTLKLGWNAEELRVLYWVEDNYVWATLTEPGALLYEEEVVEVFLDPVGDLQRYFEFEVNPLNAVLDLVLWREGGELQRDFQWCCDGLKTAARRTPEGWCAELAIPFKSLGAAPQGQWRANFYRIDRPKGVPRELSAWSPTGELDFHLPARFGVLEFTE